MSSPSHLSTPAVSRCDFLRTSSHSSSPSPISTTSSSPNLYVTYKVLQLVDTFRQRVRKRVTSDRVLRKDTSTRATRKFCQDLERQAFEEIDLYLGRKTTTRPRKRSYPLFDHESANEDEAKPNQPKRATIATAVGREPPSNSIEWLLRELDGSVKSQSNTLIAVAKDHELFLKRNTDFHVERLSLKEHTQLLVVVKDLLSTFPRSIPSRRGIKTLVEGNELLDLDADETVIANLEHLLLCLKDQLILLLVSRLVDLVHKQLIECQRDQYRHCEDWFFEFPDSRHPLSTTWPWNIRSSLAVIWGVCWMFYDIRVLQSLADSFGIPLEEAVSILAQSQADGQGYHHPGQLNSQQRSSSHPRSPHQMSGFNSPNADAAMPAPLNSGMFVATHTGHPSSHAQFPSAPVIQAATASVNQSTNTLYGSSAAPHSYAALATSSNFFPGASLPEVPLHQPDLYQDNAYAAGSGAHWNRFQGIPGPSFDNSWQQQQYVAPTTLPPQTRPPGIRLDTTVSSVPHQQWPQEYHSSGNSATTLSATSTNPLQEQLPFSRYRTHLSPLDAHNPMHQPDENMQHTPPRSPQTVDAALGEQLSRKRSHEQMTSGSLQYTPAPAHMDQTTEHMPSRAGSVSSQAQDYSTPIRNIAVQRGDPPTNAQNKFICEFSPECSDFTFDRKCEWSKHMDKHDRPYRCQREECAKLQGFTYSGGLLRHEREVHNKHGGPKSKLVCPHADCKRHNGKGFTRKENLNEHLRRVHENKETQSQSQAASVLKHETNDGTILHAVENADTPYYTQLDSENMDSPSHKRRRGMSEHSGSDGIGDLRQVVDRLQQDNHDKDAEIQRMRAQLDDLLGTVSFLREQVQLQQASSPAQGQV